MFKKRELLLFSQDRVAMTLLIVLVLSSIALLTITLFNIRVSDVQVPIRYSGYGFTNLYRDRWFALLAFGIFPIIVFLTNGYIAAKLHSTRRGLALGILSISLIIILISFIVANAVFRLAAFSL